MATAQLKKVSSATFESLIAQGEFDARHTDNLASAGLNFDDIAIGGAAYGVIDGYIRIPGEGYGNSLEAVSHDIGHMLDFWDRGMSHRLLKSNFGFDRPTFGMPTKVHNGFMTEMRALAYQALVLEIMTGVKFQFAYDGIVAAILDDVVSNFDADNYAHVKDRYGVNLQLAPYVVSQIYDTLSVPKVKRSWNALKKWIGAQTAGK